MLRYDGRVTVPDFQRARSAAAKQARESATEEDFRRQFETNFWGVYNVSRAAIPLLREQGGGLIMQFSSVGGRVGGSPGIAIPRA